MSSTHKASYNRINITFLKKVIIFFILHISRQFFIPPTLRPFLLKFCGVKFKNSKNVFIGTDVLFDNLKNTSTIIGENVIITTGVKILNHFPIISREGITDYKLGNVIIKDNVFIGMNTLIVNPITIGKNSVIAAGSVLNKDVPPFTIVGGNPAKHIKNID